MSSRVWIVVLAVACASHDRSPPVPPKPAPEPAVPAALAALVAPGPRLPDGAFPLAYDLRLEVDPERADFTGHVAIRVALAAPSDHVWIHADELDIAQASFEVGGTRAPLAALAPLGGTGDRMRVFGFGRTLPAGEVALVFDYTGHMRHDEEGLFRQNEAGRWYVFSQGQSVLARRIVPCFDEPRFKTPWKLALVVPADAVALANTPQLAEHARSDGLREVTFAETPAMASYLLALAVGPFELVDAGTGGSGHVPLRVAALAGERDKVGVVRAKLPDVIAAAEAAVGEPLPLRKLDFVVVPHLFGAMENPGLVTFDSAAIVGNERDLGFARHFVRVAAHEVIHQWFGDVVTPAWWDDLWLAEAFASWLGDRIAGQLDALGDPELYFARRRHDALAADAEPDARPLHGAIDYNDDDAGFDTIAYEKGGAVLATLDVASPAWRRGVDALLRAHRNGTATTGALADALADHELARALVDYVDHRGAPIVELALRCAPSPQIEAHVRDDRIAPVCLRYGDGKTSRVDACRLVHGAATFDVGLPGCPTWVSGNRFASYYQVVWRSGGPLGPLAPARERTPRELLALGDDVASSLVREELSPRDAAAALVALAADSDPYAQLAALAIAHELDALVADAARPRWEHWLAARFAPRLTVRALLAPAREVDVELRDGLADLVPARAVSADVRRAAARALDDNAPDPALVTFAAPVAGVAELERLVDVARSQREASARVAAVEAIGRFGVAELPRALDFFVHATEIPAPLAWRAVAGYFERAETRNAAAHAVATHAAEIFARLLPTELPDALAATASLCDPHARAEIADAFAPRVNDFAAAHQALDRALAAVDRCISRRAHAGDLSSLLAK